MNTSNNQNSYTGVHAIGGGMMGDKDYYYNKNSRNKPPTDSKPDFSDLHARQQGPNNMAGDRTNGSELNDNLPKKPSQPAQRDPQEFADQKKSEVKNSYSTSKSDRINNAYRDHYGRNAHADEISSWTGTGMGIEDIQKGLKTSFARDGEHLTGDQLAALQMQQPSQPSTPAPAQPEAPSNTQQPAQPEAPSNYEKFDNRFAASDQFKNELNEAKNLGQPQASSSSPQRSNYSNSPQQSGNSNSDSIGIDNNQALNTGRQRVDNMLDSSQSFGTQLSREADMRNSSPNTQDSTDFVKKYSLLNRDMQRDNGNPFDIANQAVSSASKNSQIDLKALNNHIAQTPLYSGARSELFGLQVFGDKYRNARENPVSWQRPDAAKPVESPDFMGIYDRTKEDLDGIKI